MKAIVFTLLFLNCAWASDQGNTPATPPAAPPPDIGIEFRARFQEALTEMDPQKYHLPVAALKKKMQGAFVIASVPNLTPWYRALIQKAAIGSNRKTGLIFVDRTQWDKLSPVLQRALAAHEILRFINFELSDFKYTARYLRENGLRGDELEPLTLLDRMEQLNVEKSDTPSYFRFSELFAAASEAAEPTDFSTSENDFLCQVSEYEYPEDTHLLAIYQKDGKLGINGASFLDNNLQSNNLVLDLAHAELSSSNGILSEKAPTNRGGIVLEMRRIGVNLPIRLQAVGSSQIIYGHCSKASN